MKALQIFLIFQMVAFSWSFSQLSVSNGNFSQASDCPVFVDEFDLLLDWQKLTGEPDFYDCDFTFLIDFAVSDHDPGYGKYVGIKMEDDSLSTADAFGQNLNETILPNESVTLSFTAQTVHAGAYKGDCAGIALYGFEDALTDTLGLNNISESQTAVELGSTAIIDEGFWRRKSITFTALDTINALAFSPEIVSGCRQYFFIDEVSITRNYASLSESAMPNLQVFPNPCQDKISLSSPMPLKGHSYTLYALEGSIVQSGVIVDDFLPVDTLEPGTYLLSVKSPSGIFNTSFVKL